MPAHRQRTITRRALLAGAAGVVAGSTTGLRIPGARAATPRIAIIGAGLAGLTCAYRLQQAGLASTVYEAHTSRIGGRCWTARGFASGQTAEHGGEFIDSVHHQIRGLAAELGLHLDDVLAIEDRHTRSHKRIYLDGAVRRASEVYQDESVLQRAATVALRQIGSYHWNTATRAARALDEMTTSQWLDTTMSGESNRLLRLGIGQYMSEEYGLDGDRLSAINIVTGFADGGVPSNERFHVHGGNDQIPHGLAARLPSGTVQLDHALRGLRQAGDGSYELSFSGQRTAVRADVVVLALPFTALRQVDLDGAGLSVRKRRCIDELGMGTNAKVIIQLDRHPFALDQWDGEYYDEQIDTWDSSFGEVGPQSMLTTFSGGRFGARYPSTDAHAPCPADVQTATLARIARAVPGLDQAAVGQGWLDHWSQDPWTHGSYAAFLPGQYTRYWGFVGRAEGSLHFAGEHTAMKAQGYLEGAVRSGERCAREVAAAV